MDTIERPYACLCLWETIHKLSVTPDQRRPVHWTRKLSNTARIVVPHDSLRSEFLHSRQLINCTGEKKTKDWFFFSTYFCWIGVFPNIFGFVNLLYILFHNNVHKYYLFNLNSKFACMFSSLLLFILLYFMII